VKIILVTIISILAIPAWAQYSIEGTVADRETKETLVGATIYFPVLYRGTTTDNNGQYKLTQLPKGHFTFEVSFIGYKSKIIHIHLERDTIINIVLNPDLKEMKEVIVTGLSRSTVLKVSPVPAVVTTRKELFSFQATNLIDAITEIPGIDQITTGVAISKPIIRGLGGNRILTLYNGLRQEGQQWGDEHGIEIDEYAIDKVEIIKGPGSIAYGSDALAGVINFLTPLETEEGKIKGVLDASYQTNNNQYNISGATSGNINGINWRARVTRKQAGNYKNEYDGPVFNSGFNEVDWDAHIGLNKSWGFVHFYASSFNQQLGIIEGERDTNGNFLKQDLDASGNPVSRPVSAADLSGYQINIPNQRVRHQRFGTSNQYFFKASSLNLKLDYQINQRQEFGDILDSTSPALYFKLNTFNYSLKYSFPEKKHWDTSLGINGMVQSNSNLGLEALIPEYSLVDGGIYLLTQKQFDKFMISGGIRFDSRSINSKQLIISDAGTPQEKFAPFTKTFSNVSASGGISYQASEKWSFKLNLARGFRAPSLAELSSNGAHEGSFQYEYGNTELLPETSLQTDLGIDYDTDHTTIQFALFYNNIDNFIYLQKLLNDQGNDSIPDPGSGTIAFQYVQGSANLFGGEAGIDIHPHPFDWLHFENTFSIVIAQQSNQPDSSKYLPFIPGPKFTSELRANIEGKSKRLTSNFIKLNWQYYFEQNRIFSAYGTETVTPAYALLNAGIGTTIKNAQDVEIISIVLLANNILNISYQNHLNRLKYAPTNPVSGRQGVFNMGRNFSFKIRVPVNFK